MSVSVIFKSLGRSTSPARLSLIIGRELSGNQIRSLFRSERWLRM